MSALDYWAADPDSEPRDLVGASVLLDGTSVGPKDYTVSGAGATRVSVVITCASSVHYRIGLLDPTDESEFSWTSGESCGGPTIGIYTTAELAAVAGTFVVRVEVPVATQYSVAVLGMPKESPISASTAIR